MKIVLLVKIVVYIFVRIGQVGDSSI